MINVVGIAMIRQTASRMLRFVPWLSRFQRPLMKPDLTLIFVSDLDHLRECGLDLLAIRDILDE
jgi:hypothetical protein